MMFAVLVVPLISNKSFFYRHRISAAVGLFSTNMNLFRLCHSPKAPWLCCLMIVPCHVLAGSYILCDVNLHIGRLLPYCSTSRQESLSMLRKTQHPLLQSQVEALRVVYWHASFAIQLVKADDPWKRPPWIYFG
mmetsp:Transcript_19252/g.26548  ORF Transcript_19252/g.26548 Transcript_19252/m.26548 type:complete len:134 (+) Transcript_19252:355-756(+)